MTRYLTGLALAAFLTAVVGCAPPEPDAGMDSEAEAPAMEESTPDSNATVAPETPATPETPAAEEETPAAEEEAPAAAE